MAGNPLQTLTESIERGFVRATALMVIVLSVSVLISHFVVGILIGPYESATNRMQLAARQANSVQEIVRITTRLGVERSPGALYKLRADLSAELETFSDNHRRLAEGDPAGNILRRMSRESQELFFDPSKGIDRWAKDIEAAARDDFLSNTLAGDPAAAQHIEEMVRTAFAPRLSQLIDHYARDNWLNLRLIALVRTIFLGFFYLSLAVAAAMILRPLARQTIRNIRGTWLDERAELANFDPATGLPNKGALVEFVSAHCDLNWTHDLRQAVLRLEVTAPPAALNNEGELVPQVSKAIAQRMKAVCRQGDFLARLDGQEFGVIAIGLDSRPAVQTLSERLITRLAQDINLQGMPTKLEIRIGASFVDKRNRQISEVLNQTKRALAAGAGSQQKVHFYEKPRGFGKSAEPIAQELKTALEAYQIAPLFQPLVSGTEARVVGTDVSPAWLRPEQDTVGHNALFAAAQSAGLIPDVVQASVDATLAAVSEWDMEGFEVPMVYMRLRASELCHEGVMQDIQSTLNTNAISAERIQFSLPEADILADHTGQLLETVQDLALMGCRFAVHEFGAGKFTRYHAKRYRIATLSLSRAFVTNVNSDADQQLIVAEKLTLAKDCGTALIAEGAESPAERAMLLRLGCQTISGPLICEPGHAPEIGRWLDQRARVRA